MNWLEKIADWVESDRSDVPFLWAGAAGTLICAGLAAVFIAAGWWYAAALDVAAVIILGSDTAKYAGRLRARDKAVDRNRNGT